MPEVGRMTATGPYVIPNGGSSSQVAWDGARHPKAMDGCRPAFSVRSAKHGPDGGRWEARRGWAGDCSNRPGRYFLSGRGLAQPVVETDLTPNRVFSGDERPFGQHRAEVEGLRIGHYLARVVPRGEEMSDHFVKAELLGAADFDDAVDRGTDGGPRYGRGDIVRGDGLEQHWCQADGIAVGRGVRDVLDELEELRRVHDRVWDRRSLDQCFLSDFRSEVPTLRQAVGAHDR